MSLVIGKSVSDLNYIGQHNIFMLMWGSTVSFGEHPPFTANERQPWTDSHDYYFEYLIIHFDYLIIQFDYLIIG